MKGDVKGDVEELQESVEVVVMAMVRQEANSRHKG